MEKGKSKEELGELNKEVQSAVRGTKRKSREKNLEEIKSKINK